MIELYTDGATSKNGSEDAVGGWAWCIVKDREIVAKDSGAILEGATNNVSELTALINGCLAASDSYPNDAIIVYSDSSYCVNCRNQGWYKKWQQNGWKNGKDKPVANKELWLQLIPFFKSMQFDFKKVEGHAGIQYNELVDKMAVQARTEGEKLLNDKCNNPSI